MAGAGGRRHSWLQPNVKGIPAGVLDIEDIRAAVGTQNHQFNPEGLYLYPTSLAMLYNTAAPKSGASE